jgi:hypothetical protein
VRLTGEQLTTRGAVDIATALALLPDRRPGRAGRRRRGRDAIGRQLVIARVEATPCRARA